ncbi:unnamed protein product, partial [Iphiclides podalirius]
MIKTVLIFAIAMLAEVSLGTPRVADEASTNNAALRHCPCAWHCYIDTNGENKSTSTRSGNDEMRNSVLVDARERRQYGLPLPNFRLYNVSSTASEYLRHVSPDWD